MMTNKYNPMKAVYYKYPTRFTPAGLKLYLAQDNHSNDFIPYKLTEEPQEIKEVSKEFLFFDLWLATQNPTRKINTTVVHCTATVQTAKVASIINYWKNTLGWNSPGYAILILPDGTYSILATLQDITNGVYGHNKDSVHISYIGGVDEEGKGLDNRTDEQKETLKYIVEAISNKFKTNICGHRDFKNVAKECPSFEVSNEFKNKK